MQSNWHFYTRYPGELPCNALMTNYCNLTAYHRASRPHLVVGIAILNVN